MEIAEPSPSLDAEYSLHLNKCGSSKLLGDGKRIHARIISCALSPSMIIWNALLNMYIKCGSVQNATQEFDRMPKNNVVAWTVMIGGYVKYGEAKKALYLFQQMEQHRVKPDRVAFISVLKACSSMRDLNQGRHIHTRTKVTGKEVDIYVGNTLVDMYAKCGSIVEAREVFCTINKRDIVSWNALVTGSAQNDDVWWALRLFEQMQQEGIKPNRVTLVSVLNSCAAGPLLHDGKLIHAYLAKGPYRLDPLVLTILVDMYGKYRSLNDADTVFRAMPVHDILSWNSVIAAYAQQGLGHEAIALFQKMHDEALNPNKATIVSVLNGCSSISALCQGKRIHACIISCEHESDVVLQNKLIDMYSKCGSIEDAIKVFNTMAMKDVISWNAIISGYSQHNYGIEALHLFDQVYNKSLNPDGFTYNSLLNACSKLGALEKGKRIHAFALAARCASNYFVSNMLINMYAKCGNTEASEVVFNSISTRDEFSWNSLILGYGLSGDQKTKAFDLFFDMQRLGLNPDAATFIAILNACTCTLARECGKWVHAHIIRSTWYASSVVANTLIDMYISGKDVMEAQRVFNMMSCRDVILWNTMLGGYAHDAGGKEMLACFSQLRWEGVLPDKITYITCLGVCADTFSLAYGKLLHSHINISDCRKDIVVGNALINMYAKCGRMENASQVFRAMIEHDVKSWTAMIGGYVQNTDGKEALAMFAKMQQASVHPDNVTFISLLNGCGLVAALGHGRLVHAGIMTMYKNDIIMSSVIIDMYGRCGEIGEARKIFDQLATRNIITWNAMIEALAQHGNAVEAIHLFCQMQQDGSIPNLVSFVSILTACSHAGLLDEGNQHYLSCQHYGVTPNALHYSCIVDLLCRLGWLAEADDLITSSSHKTDVNIWMTLIGACRFRGNSVLARYAMEHALVLDPGYAAVFVSVSNILALDKV